MRVMNCRFRRSCCKKCWVMFCDCSGETQSVPPWHTSWETPATSNQCYHVGIKRWINKRAWQIDYWFNDSGWLARSSLRRGALLQRPNEGNCIRHLFLPLCAANRHVIRWGGGACDVMSGGGESVKKTLICTSVSFTNILTFSINLEFMCQQISLCSCCRETLNTRL